MSQAVPPSRARDELPANVFETLLQHSPHLVGLLSPEGDMRYMSPAAIESFCGRDVDAWDSQRGLDAMHPDDFDTVVNAFEAALAQPGLQVTFAHRLLHPSGEV